MSEYVKKSDVRHLLLHNDREAALAQLDELEAVDLVPFRYARKIRIFSDPWTDKLFTTCSACDEKIRKKDKFCWNCGRKFDEEKGE